MRTIIWTDLALSDYHENIDYLLQRWSEKEALSFVKDVEIILFDLKKGNIEFKESSYKSIKECVIRKQVSLYYRLIDKNKIELLRFWNNYQDDKELRF
ncbi:MAG TPA: type II toxin-antitoxin system RelE/ParE family toxin [Marinilabiliaceae bacterium]|nr:type II toxin-antitoxin system RelE/ParE family toxin [Marinilabiliaceae bacterium]